ncbi:MAG: hypothetical protein ACYSSO_08450 [Planctomycetota bacterium]|jgi:uncharacterized protein YidB (DUF937 family)
MLRKRDKILAVLVLIGALVSTTAAQEQGYLQEQMEEQLEQMRESGREAFLGVLQYPQDVWKAMLELAQYPDLVVKLSFFTDTADKPVAKLYEVLGSYPKEVQEAAKLMVYYPDVLGVMEEHLVLTGLIGAVYQNDKDKVLQVVSQMAKQAGQEHEGAVDKWVERLENNPESVEQLSAACKAYADETGQPEQLASETGAAVSEANEVQVSGLPDANFVTYVLENSQEYPYLTEEMLEYFEDYYDDDYYDRYYGYPGHYPYYYQPSPVLDAVKREVLRQHLEDRPVQGPVEQRLRNQFAFEDEFAKSRLSQADLNRQEFLRENTARFPNVQRRTGEPRTRTEPAKTRQRDERAKARTRGRDTARAIHEHEQRARVRREKATRDQQISRARSNHRNSWNRSADRSRRRRPADRRRPTRRPSRGGRRR